MSLLNKIPLKSPHIIARRTGDEYVLVPVTDSLADMTGMYTLNETAAFIWDHIDGSATVADIAAAVAEEYDTDNDTAARDVVSFVKDVREYLIIEL